MTQEKEGNWLTKQARKEAKTYAMNTSQRTGQIATAIGPLIGLLFFAAHQMWSTGFFTSKFGLLEAFLFYSLIVIGILNAIIRGILGRKNTLRPFEIGWIIYMIIAFICLLAIFPFDFSHLADVLPNFLRFLLAWISDEIAKALVILAILGTTLFTIYDALLYVYVRRELSKTAPKPA
jgi:cytochrome bd-type quinol oxidase subunit 2